MQLQSQDPSEAEKGLAAIRQRFRVNGERTAQDFRQSWCSALMKEHRFDDAADLCVIAICARAGDVNFVEDLLRRRVAALLAAGRNEEALQAAKGLYNVCWLKRTAEAINLLGDVILAARPDDGAQLVHRLVAEQVAGAERSPATQPAADASPTPGHSVLAGIKVDDHPYFSRLQKLESRSDYNSLYARGNLLLLADRPADATQVFRQAYAVAPEKSLAAATEAMARAMRAADGATGRADAWILELRPTKPQDAAGRAQ
jgi:tetratricopeptide (TPR) repeat protein